MYSLVLVSHLGSYSLHPHYPFPFQSKSRECKHEVMEIAFLASKDILFHIPLHVALSIIKPVSDKWGLFFHPQIGHAIWYVVWHIVWLWDLMSELKTCQKIGNEISQKMTPSAWPTRAWCSEPKDVTVSSQRNDSSFTHFPQLPW